MQELVGQCSSYRLETLVARGRSGELHQATMDGGDVVAIKLHDRISGAIGEAEALKTIDHHGVASLIDQGETADGRRWLALRWIEGRTLAHVLATEGPLSIERSYRLVEQLAAAVDAVHDAGYLHGDLSPRNVMVDLHDRIVLVDFGSASRLGDIGGGADVTTGVDLDTTPRYSSPEVAAGSVAGPASDRYAVGLIAYEALTGAFPFPEVSTPIAMLAHHGSTEPVPPSEHRPGLPAELDKVFARALDKDPLRRQARAVDIAAALRSDQALAPSGRGLVPRLPLLPRPPLVRRLSSAPGLVKAALLGLATAAISVFVVSLAGVGPFGIGRDGFAGSIDAEAGLPLSITELATAGPAGRARGVACNLLESPGFETGRLPNGFYSGDERRAVELAPGAGVDASTALQVGEADRYGIFGEVVPIERLLGANEEMVFVFTVWARFEGQPVQSGIYIDYLDDQFEQLTFRRDGLSVEATGSEEGTRVTVQSVAPVNASYAVPTIFKDGSSGSLFVDEVVFAAVSLCEEPA